MLVACGYAAVDGDPLQSSVDLPSRAFDAGTEEASSPVTSDPTPATDGGDAAAASTTCAGPDLALCFAFDGNTVDQSAAKLTPDVVANISFAPGKAGQAASFVATSALRFAPNAAFELPAGAATIEAWIKRQNAGADAVVFDDDGRFSLTINAAGNVWCKSSGGAITGGTVVPVDQWAHVACVIDAGTMRAYLNGNEDASGPGAVGSSPTSPAAIGGNSPDGEPFLGLIDSFRVFRSARTPAQIAAAAL
ncbi:MAG: hypothetical protein K0S65_6708 [Labilithrix sp.]|nr:hypothetical protein [Labilithrix sp.]